LTRLAIIPARGGSKRIPRKNIRDFQGRPIIAWSIDTARQSGLFDEVLVSTEDAEIAQVAQALGAAVPFLRSARNADDHATTTDVIREVLERYKKQVDVACCIYPTAPFVTTEDLAEGLRLLEDNDVVLPVSRFGYPIWRSLSRSEDGRVSLNFPEHAMSRSQDLPAAYHDAGQWLWLRVAPFLAGGALLGPRTGSVILPIERVQDIDTEEDWREAEAKFGWLRADVVR
jgi:pseudaminic acid cytidylyltransferase